MPVGTTPPQPAAPPAPEAQEREVSLHEGMKGIDQNDQGTGATGLPDSPNADKDVVDIIQPKAEPKVWKLGKETDGTYREYTQRPLGFLAKMQWFSLVGEVLDKSMSGEDALSINSLLSAPAGRGGTLSMSDFRDADTFVQAVGKLLIHAPDFLVKSYCIWLSVPDYEQDFVASVMALPAEQGGLSDDDGLEIIEIFIDQNYEALDSFFREKLSRIRTRIQARQEAAGA